jgi:hypothetical protein
MSLRDESIFFGPGGTPVERVVDLTVSEMVELAKAGVKVELAGRVAIAPPLPVPPTPTSTYDENGQINLTELIRQRWRMSRLTANQSGMFMEVGPQLSAVRHEEKIYVFAYSGRAEPEVIVDDAAIYPSDALLARIHLMMQHAK